MRCLSLWCLALFFSLPCSGGPVVLLPSTESVSLLPYAQITTDLSGTASLTEIRRTAVFSKLPKGKIPPGFGEKVYWLRWTVINRDPDFHQQIFQISPPWYLESTLFVVTPGESVQTHPIGMAQPFWGKELPHPAQLDLIKIQPGKTAEVYLRVKVYVGEMNLVLWRTKSFIKEDWQRSYVLAGLMGMLAAVGLYNLFIYFTVRDRVYLYYVVTVFSGLCYGLNIEGVQAAISPESPYWSRYSVVLFIGLGYFSHLLFARKFLETKKYTPRVDRVLLFLMGFSLIVSLLATQMHHWIALYSVLATGLALVCAPVLSGLGIYIYLVKKRRQARLYALSTTFLQVWLILQSGHMFGLWGGGSTLIWGASGLLIGFSVMDLALSFALADRINWLQREKTQADQALLGMKSGEALRLMEQVEQRTVELSQRNEQQHLLISIIGHDLRGPAGAVMALLQDFVKGDKEIPKHELRTVAEAATDLYVGLEDLLKWAKSFQDGLEFERERLSFTADIYDNIWPLLKPTARSYGVNIELEIETQEIYGEVSAVQAVLRNLVANAIKATDDVKNIVIRVADFPEENKVSVINDGPCLTIEQIERLNQITAATDLSSGLGLLLCRQLVAAWDGKVEFQVTEDGQTEASFTLPKPASYPGLDA